MKGLNWQPLQLPMAAGMNQKADDRALPAPSLAAAVDVQFDEVGGIQTRKPFSLVGSTIASGGTISTARRMYEYGRELVMFTKDTVYSWNDQLNRWVFRATHLAISTDETTAFSTPGDAYDCDRAELLGIVYYAWTDTDKVYVAAVDKASGAVINAPTAVSGTGTRPRLLALSTRVLLFWHAGTDSVVGNQYCLSIDPTATDPATLTTQLGGSGWLTVLASANCGAYYDVASIPSAGTALWVGRRAVTTSYEVVKIPESTSGSTSLTKGRTCDGPIAVSADPTGTTAQVLRGNGTNIQGDRLTVSSLADAATGQAVGTVAGTPVSQIACAHQSVTNGGYYRCYAFWSASESASGSGLSWLSKYNYVDTNGTIGTQANLVHGLGIGSRAFDHDGSVYFWGVFAGESAFSGAGPGAFRAQLQNTYFLYRDDATLHAKCAPQRAGGLAPSVGRLPGVALTSGTTVYSWCATERRIINVGSAGTQQTFDKRAPRDVTFTFDSNAARRCVKLGEALYVSGSEILQYDGVGLYEVGFHVYPWDFAGVMSGAGNIADGTYTYKCTWRWENAKGESERSTTATTGEITVSAGPKLNAFVITPLTITRKKTTKPPAIELWRTAVNPGDGAPFYLVTSKNPATTSNPNRYLANDPTTYFSSTLNDSFADATLITKETNDENGDVLENLAPPGASIIAATDTRIFLGGVAGDPDRVWYSKLRQDGRVASFHDALTFDVPKDGGDITGIAFQNGICVVFREYATYMFPGDGFDNTQRGQNFGPPQVVSYDVGCRDTDSIVNTPEGIAFQSSKGKYLLTRGWTMQPIGEKVVDYDSETVVAAHIVPGQHQVRFLTASRMLVWDYRTNNWAERTITSGVHAAVWQGAYHYLVAAGPMAEQSTYSGTAYGLDVETAWIKPGDLQGAAEIRKPLVLGEHRGGTWHLRCRVAYDYKATWVDDTYWLAAPNTSGLPLQHLIPTSRRRVEAIKFRLTVVGAATQATMSTSAVVPLVRIVGETTENWAATFTSIPLGSLGNGFTLSIALTITAGVDDFIDVRDHQTWNSTTDAWETLANNVGIHVITAAVGRVTIAEIEAAINADSALLDVTTPHPNACILNATSFVDTTFSFGTTAGGAFAAPSGESLKLTGLGLEAGVVPHLHRRYPRT